MAFNVGILEKDLLDALMRVMKFAVTCYSKESQNLIVDKAYSVLSSTTSLLLKGSLCTFPAQVEGLKPHTDKFSNRDKWILSLFASVIIALHPQMHVPSIRMVLHLFLSTLLHCYVTAAQVLNYLLNKLDLKSNGPETSVGCNFDEAVYMILWMNVILLTVILRGEQALGTRQFHGTIKPLYKQRFFFTMMPILQPLIIKSNSSFSRKQKSSVLLPHQRCLIYKDLSHEDSGITSCGKSSG